jgi:DNA mismatch repair ATPase MutS
MRETSYLINNLTPRSLVIIDELGKGTSNIDGVSIAFAVAESLLFTPAYTLFVTHYTQLTSLSSMYSNAKNVHFKTSIDVSSSNCSGSLIYMYQLDAGPCDMISGYGN